MAEKSKLPPQLVWQNAVAAFEAGQPEKSKQYLSMIIDHPSADGNTWLLAGLVECQLGYWETAEQYLRKAVWKLPENIQAWMTLGSVLQNLGRAEEAVPVFQRVTEIDASNFQGFNNMAVALEDMGRALAALSNYQMALSISPKFTLALQGRAQLLGRMRRFDEACLDYEELIKQHPEDYGVALEYCELLEQSNLPDDVAKVLPGNIDSEDFGARARLASIKARLLMRDDKYEQALGLLEEAINKTRQDSLLFLSGKILDRMGKYE